MNKSPDAFRTISEVADLLETPAHVLRFWESRFPQIKPVKRAGGRRYYRPADVELLIGIRRLLHDDGMTIRGVQKILREQGVRHVSGLSDEDELEDLDLPFEATAKTSSDPIVLFPRPKPPVEAGQPPVAVAVAAAPPESDAAKGPDDDALRSADAMGVGPATPESGDVASDPAEPDLATTAQDKVAPPAEAATLPEAAGVAEKAGATPQSTTPAETEADSTFPPPRPQLPPPALRLRRRPFPPPLSPRPRARASLSPQRRQRQQAAPLTRLPRPRKPRSPITGPNRSPLCPARCQPQWKSLAIGCLPICGHFIPVPLAQNKMRSERFWSGWRSCATGSVIWAACPVARHKR